jgi:hypothetical protein
MRRKKLNAVYVITKRRFIVCSDCHHTVPYCKCEYCGGVDRKGVPRANPVMIRDHVRSRSKDALLVVVSED